MKPYERGRVSALLGPHWHALARMQIYDDHTVKTNARTMWKSQIHSHNIQNSGIDIFLGQRTRRVLLPLHEENSNSSGVLFISECFSVSRAIR